MNASRGPKAMAKTLRADLAAREITLSHAECLEIVAHQLGQADWNAASALLTEPLASLTLPEGWFAAGSNPHDYNLGVDPSVDGAATIMSKRDGRIATGFATMMQTFDATAYHGKRIELIGELSTRAAVGFATMWLRVDSVDGRQICLDNMEGRTDAGVLRGTNDWVKRAIVVDIPEQAGDISYGFFLDGNGQCWCRGFDLRTVDAAVELTQRPKSPLNAPANMGFAPRNRVA